MAAAALLLTLGAAALHAGWNLLVAGAEDTDAVTAVMLAVAVVVFAPVAAVTWDVDPAAAPYLVASGVLELAYAALLAAAYRGSELSLVYPLARGLAPVLVLALAAALGARPSGVEAAGVLLVAFGVVLVRGLRRGNRRGVVLGAAIAACIAGYTLVDKAGIAHADPIAYLELALLLPALAYPAAVARARGVAPLRAALRPRAAVAGAAMFGAYALVLAALDRAPAAPVAAVRETSIVLATALAALVLRERVGPARAAGAAAVAGGVALIALG
jgi:drug/metabolite transporter (DMT)-like permease